MPQVIGHDGRVRSTNNEVYPWRCICSLLITSSGGATYSGTGWLVGPRILLTAGHCVYMPGEGGWVSEIEVIPGRNADARPFGSAVARDFRSVSGWSQDGDSDYDYGAILLPADKRFGEQLGWFGYANRADDYLRRITVNLAGYPGDGGKAPNQVEGTQWFHSGTLEDVLPKQLTYEIDTYGGQSGAPVWEVTSDGSCYGLALHTFGATGKNGGTRITSEVFDNIVQWAGQVPSGVQPMSLALGSIAGRVVDAGGNPVPDATVAVTGSTQPGRDIAAITNAQGVFRVGGMRPGSYGIDAHIGNARGGALVAVAAGSPTNVEIKLG